MKPFRLLPLLLVGLLACSKSAVDVEPAAPGNGSSSPATGIPTEVGQPVGTPISKIIGPAGGTLATPDGKLKLIIPAGALNKEMTITAQPVENKAYGGTSMAYALTPENLPLLTEAQLTLTYTPEEVEGSAPEALGIAHQDQNKVWQAHPNAKLDKVKQTVTVPVSQLAHWAFYEQFFLRADREVLAPGETAHLTAYYLEDREDDPTAPYPLVPAKVLSASRIVRWTINGVTNGSTSESNYGSVGQIAEDRTWAKATYDAPIREPDTNPVAVGAELDLKPFGRVILVQPMRVESVALLNIGEAIDNNPNVALTSMGSKLMGAITSASPTGRPMLSFIIDDFRGKGTYTFPEKGPNSTIAAGSSGIGYSHGYHKPYSNEWVSGNLTLTITEYGGPGKPIRGNLSGSYFEGMTAIPATTRFRGVPAVVPQ